jgi:hypothetical protein
MATLGSMPAPQMEQLDPSIDGAQAAHPQKPTNSLEDREPLSDGPNEGPPPKLDALPVP